MAIDPSSNDIPLPRSWPEHVKSALLHVISMAQLAVVRARGWAANSSNSRVRLQARLEEANQEIALLNEELRIKDARMAGLDPRRRPHYCAVERLAILELRAARGWSRAQTARRFLVQAATLASWMKRIDESGESALVKICEPVNRFPDFVRRVVRRLKTLCPTMGKKRIAQTLARAGLHLGITTVGRMLKERKPEMPESTGVVAGDEVFEAKTQEPVSAKQPNHVWLTDLTLMPTSAGFWVPWLPFAIPQAWPFCWWVACVVDLYSRRVIGFAVFAKEPTSVDIRSFLARAMSQAAARPKYIVSDKGGQFYCPGFKAWCRRKGIQARYAAAEKRGATAVIERFFRSLKDEWLRRIAVPLRRDAMRRELSCYVAWFHELRPHQGLSGRTPVEVYDGLEPANTAARMEPRPRWPTDSRCALPSAKLASRPRGLVLNVTFHGGSPHLPVAELKEAA